MAAAILVVDDDEMVRMNLELVLTLEGYLVTTAGSGLAALEILQDRRVDAIVLDISMPGIDGWETLRQIRGRTERPPAPVIALTGDNRDSREFRSAGFNAYLSKGGSLDQFLCTVRSAVASAHLVPNLWLHSCNGQRCLTSRSAESPTLPEIPTH